LTIGHLLGRRRDVPRAAVAAFTGRFSLAAAVDDRRSGRRYPLADIRRRASRGIMADLPVRPAEPQTNFSAKDLFIERDAAAPSATIRYGVIAR
jgi:hypothetical protein